MKYYDFAANYLSELAETVQESDICEMQFHHYTMSLYMVNKRITAYRGALQRCSDPETIKDYVERRAFIKYAEAEANAGDQLLKLFMADPRFEAVDKELKEKSDNYNEIIGHWDDFIAFYERSNASKDKHKPKPKHKGSGAK